jgi:hypothetical protein
MPEPFEIRLMAVCLDGGEIGRGVIGADPVIAVTETHVHKQMRVSRRLRAQLKRFASGRLLMFKFRNSPRWLSGRGEGPDRFQRLYERRKVRLGTLLRAADQTIPKSVTVN